MTPQSTRLVFGFLTPVAVLSAAAVLAGVAMGVGGCAGEQSSPGASMVGAPSNEARFEALASSYANEPARGANRGENARFARTFASTANLLPGVGNGSHAGTGPGGVLEQLFGGTGTEGGGFAAFGGLCPPDMASIDDRFCVDRYEASLLEVLADGSERPFSPYEMLHGQTVRAVSEPGVYPQGYISEVQAIQACALSGKRLCKAKEWKQACMGPAHKTYGYADHSAPGKCNDHGRSPMQALYAGENLSHRDKWDWTRMNRPELNQLDGTLAHTGEHDECTNGYGVYDMVGNLHEWVDDPNGTFQGGYYQDTTLNGEGCQYVTMAHEARYHDYSTGFRCCSDVSP